MGGEGENMLNLNGARSSLSSQRCASSSHDAFDLLNVAEKQETEIIRRGEGGLRQHLGCHRCGQRSVQPDRDAHEERKHAHHAPLQLFWK